LLQVGNARKYQHGPRHLTFKVQLQGQKVK